MSSGKAWVLVEVPPHGCCLPWPRTAGGVAEWLGAHGAICVPAWKSPRISRICAENLCGNLRGLREKWAIWLSRSHLFFYATKIQNNPLCIDKMQKMRKVAACWKKATTIGMVTSGLPRSLNGKRARSLDRKNMQKCSAT